MTSSRTKIQIIISLLVVALLLLGGLSGYLYLKLNTIQQQQAAATQTPADTPTDNPAENEPEWTPYQNTDFNLNFSYPDYMTIKNVAINPKKSIAITLSDGTDNELVIGATNIYTSTDLTTYQGKTIDDTLKLDGLSPTIEWKLFYPNGVTDQDVTTTVRAQYEKNGWLYSVTGTENLGTIIEMLSTFEFN